VAEQNRNSERELELAKMHLDTFKHLTTFCSGAILLTASVVAALFPEPARLWLLSLSIIFFVTGLTFALIGLWFTIRSQDPHMLPVTSTFLSLHLAASVLGAYLGVLAFAFFATGNLSVLENKAAPQGKEQSKALHIYPNG
jgi:hypothetical protein